MDGLRILWKSNSPHVGSGYGVQANSLLPRLAQHPNIEEISIFGCYGIQGGLVELPVGRYIPGVNPVSMLHYPIGEDKWGNDVVWQHAKHFDAHVVITLMDAWVHNENYGYGGFLWIPYAPVDHEPIPPQVLDRLRKAYHPVAYSQHADKLFQEAGLDHHYIPHGVETKIFRPYDKGGKLQAKRWLGFEDEHFLIGTVAANRGWPNRKGYPELFEAFSIFRESHPDARLAAHTDIQDNRYGGINLTMLADMYGIADYVRFSLRYNELLGLTPREMCRYYNAFDVFCLPSMGEGFGIPLIEAQACFPADTPIVAKDVLATWSRLYTGKMITMQTRQGSVRATAEHPFFTDNGWTLAKDLCVGSRLLYYDPCNACKRIQEIQQGPVGEVVSALSSYAAQGGGKASEDVLQRGILAGTSSRADGQADQSIFADPETPQDSFGATPLVHCGDDRWGWDSHAQEEVSQTTSYGFDSEYLNGTHVLAGSGIRPTERPLAGAIQQKRPLPIQDPRTQISASVPRSPPIPRHQAGEDDVASYLDREAGETVEARPLRSEDAQHICTHTRPQYEAINAISTEEVQDLPVYNLTTLSGTYLAHGYLVHNCGVPVITTDWTACAELCASGWKIKVGKKIPTPLLSHQAYADVDSLVYRMEEAYLTWKDPDALRAKQQQAREFALQYDWELLVREKWFPFIDWLWERVQIKTIRRSSSEDNGQLCGNTAAQAVARMVEVNYP